jgi:hypothetical protein
MMDKKSQSSMEFVILTGFMMLVFVIFFIVIQGRLVVVKDVRAEQRALEIASIVKNEVELANTVTEGYERVFFIPYDIDGESYTIFIYDDYELVINHSGRQFVSFFDYPVFNATPDAMIHPGYNKFVNNTLVEYS